MHLVTKMSDGRHLEKSKMAVSPHGSTDLHKIWHDDTFWPSEGYGQLKFPFPTFENPRWRTAAILRNRKRPHLRNGLTDLHKNWHNDVFWSSEWYGQLKFPTFENPRCRTAAILINCKRPYLHNGFTDLHKIWHYDVIWRSEVYRQLKISNVWKSKMADGRHLEKFNKRPYLWNGLTDLHEIWHGGANWHCKAYLQRMLYLVLTWLLL